MNLHCTALFSAINSLQKVSLQCFKQYQDEGGKQLTFAIGAFKSPEDQQQLSHDIQANPRLPTSGFWILAALGIGAGRPVVPDQSHHILQRMLQHAWVKKSFLPEGLGPSQAKGRNPMQAFLAAA
jgi:hypothetical protein